MNNKYVIIIDKSAGNETVGDMWQETKIFDGSSTLDEVMKWAMDSDYDNLDHSRKHIQITKPHTEK